MPEHVVVKILFFAGWFLSVYVHEVGHSLYARWGGDEEIGARGGFSPVRIWLTNPLLSLIAPFAALLLVGLPLPGAAVQVRADRLRSRGWRAATFLGGPLHTLLVTFCFAAVYLAVPWAPLRLALGFLVFVNAVTFMINITPVPPLDGFGVVSAWMPDGWLRRLPRVAPYVMVAVALILLRFPALSGVVGWCGEAMAFALGVDPHEFHLGRANVLP